MGLLNLILLNEEKSNAVLKVGAIKMKVSLSELIRTKKEKEEVRGYSNYEIAERQHFAVMGEKYKKDHADSEEEIWIPVRQCESGE